jgi:hypothetical protein
VERLGLDDVAETIARGCRRRAPAPRHSPGAKPRVVRERSTARSSTLRRHDVGAVSAHDVREQGE